MSRPSSGHGSADAHSRGEDSPVGAVLQQATRADQGAGAAALRARVLWLEQHLAAISTVAAAHFDSVGCLRVVPGAAHQGFAQQVEALANAALAQSSTPMDTESEEGGVP